MSYYHAASVQVIPQPICIHDALVVKEYLTKESSMKLKKGTQLRMHRNQRYDLTDLGIKHFNILPQNQRVTWDDKLEAIIIEKQIMP